MILLLTSSYPFTNISNLSKCNTLREDAVIGHFVVGEGEDGESLVAFLFHRFD